MSDKLESVVLKNFGPSVLKVKIPQNIVDSINQYIDEIIIDKKRSEALNAGNNLVGDVTQEFNLEIEFIKKSGWGIFLGSCVNKWIEFETKMNVLGVIESPILGPSGNKEFLIAAKKI